MQTKVQLELLGSLKRSRHSSTGLGLMELLIVVAIVGILSVIALPRYMQARAAVRAGALIGEQLGLARECASWLLSGGIGVTPVSKDRVCLSSSVSTYSGSWGEFGPVNRGLRCVQITDWGGVAFTLYVSSRGELTCTITGRRS